MKADTKLEEIFRIDDDEARQKALVDYARSLRVNYLKAQRPNGAYNEDELAVLIYNATQNRKVNRFQNLVFLVIGIFILVSALFAIAFLMQMVRQTGLP